MKVDAKIVDMAVLATPIKRSNGFKIVAYFTLLCRPMRIEDCKLVITPKGNFALWTPDEAIKIMGWAREELAEAAQKEFAASLKKISS